MENSVSYKAGDLDEFTVILSCPGKDEEQSNPQMPAMGKTGDNLEQLLTLLTPNLQGMSLTRGNITIANSWDKVEYEVKTGRSEATAVEVLDAQNLDRLYLEIKDTKSVILACGDNAKIAILALRYAKDFEPNVKFAFIQHLGNRGLNSTINRGVNGTKLISTNSAKIKKKNRIARLTVVMHDILTQLSES